MDFLLDGLHGAVSLLTTGNAETYSAIAATLAASSLAIAASLILGVPLGFLLGHCTFPGRKPLKTLADTLLSFPTVVVGLLVYAFLSRQGPLGELGLLFTIPGIAVGQTILGLPIVISLTASAVESLDSRLGDTLRSLGAGSFQILRSTLWEARYSLAVAGMAAYGRIVSEVGVSMMIGGNIKWHTRTITTAIALESSKGEFAMGVALGLVLLFIALAVNLAMGGLKKLAA